MSDSAAEDTIDQAAFEALRARWEQAKASGTVNAFVQEVLDQAVPLPPPADRVYESDDERAAYEWARANVHLTAEDLRALLGLYFGDEPGIPIEQILQELEASASQNGDSGTGTNHDGGG